MLDKYDEITKTTSMARTTGYSTAMAVRMLAKGMYTTKGVSPPEFVGKNHDCVKFILEGLK